MPILDVCLLPLDDLIETTIAIIGSGAAGITIAREFLGNGISVVLLESGGMDFDSAAQDVCDAETVGADYIPPRAARLRCFGGTTDVWSGLCRPLDPVDFATRDDIDDSGWPFDAATLDPYYRRAHGICQLGPFDYAGETWRQGAVGPLPLDGTSIRSAVFQMSPPTRFAASYGDELKAAKNVTVYLNAHVAEIEADPDSRTVARLRLIGGDGGRRWVRAKCFVLAAGGIENARLLLASDSAQRNGLGNEHDLVGRYFMDHPKIWKGAQVSFAEPFPELGFYDYHVVNGTRIQGVFVPSEQTLRNEGLANFTICLDRPSLADLSTSAAALRLLRRGFGHAQELRDSLRHLGRAASGVGGLAGAAYRVATKATPRTLFATRYWCDCPPDPDSRITLSDQRDALGGRRARIHWRLPTDFAWNFRRAHELLGTSLAEAGLGRLRINSAENVGDPIRAVENSCHHMGATRMHRDARRGVVDENGRVHSIGNLYVAGSSVFPTYGHANPTLTIVALSLRLADCLKRAILPERVVPASPPLETVP